MTSDMMDLSLVARQCRWNSERWFPGVHDPDRQIIPLTTYYALALAGEVGEVIDVIKKHGLRQGRTMPSPEQLGPELADVFTYLLLLADECAVDLAAAFEAKQKVCEERWG